MKNFIVAELVNLITPHIESVRRSPSMVSQPDDRMLTHVFKNCLPEMEKIFYAHLVQNDEYYKLTKELKAKLEEVEKELEAKKLECMSLQANHVPQVVKIPNNITINHNISMDKPQRNLLTKIAFLLGPSSNGNLNRWTE